MPGQRSPGRPSPFPRRPNFARGIFSVRGIFTGRSVIFFSRRAIISLSAGALLIGAAACSSASGKPAATPPVSPSGRAPASSAARPLGADCRNLGTCYSPRALRAAYGIQPLLDRGIGGHAQTVVLLETAVPVTPKAPPAPAVTDIRQDLARFDSLFGLPATQLQVVTSLAGAASPWQAAAGEVRDAEIAHAVAPDAAIRVVLAGASVASQFAALRLGLSQGAVLLISASVGEHCLTPAQVSALNSALQAAQSRHVTVVNSTGEFGAVAMPCPGATSVTPVKGVDLPAADPLVLAVGGTSLLANRTTGARISETAWNAPPDSLGAPESLASGGGFSQQFPRPSYQDGVAGIGSNRGVPDVSADADPTLGPAIVVTAGGQQYVVHPAGGTAAAAALWTGLIALADQEAGHDLGLVNPAIYRIGGSAAYHTAFHSITTGTSTVKFPAKTITGYQASSGWNPVTGWGSPNAQVLIPLIVRYG